MSQPILYVFAISHFCEKARWALDYLGIDHRLEHLPPGQHMAIAQELGAPGSSLPILGAEDGVIQGSSEIIDWAESHATNGRGLTPTAHREACEEIETRLGERIGVHTRRFYYSEALVEYPEKVMSIFTKDLAPEVGTATQEAWPVISGLMIDRMDLGAAQGEESRGILERELDWLDGLVRDGGRFLLGDHFSRADLSAASLLARFAGARELPAHDLVQPGPRMAALQERWRDRPSLAWIRDLYRDYRTA